MTEATLADRQILRAKLYVPRGRPGAVPRSRLYERLDAGVRRDLTVVSAPAGFGKTTLLADWSRQSGLPVAWVSLDERDDDPVRFFSYLMAAIGTLHEGFGETTRAFLGSLRSHEELEPVLTALSNEILEVPREFVLVLDDYHVLRSEAVHGALSFSCLTTRRRRCASSSQDARVLRCRFRGCAPVDGSPSWAKPNCALPWKRRRSSSAAPWALTSPARVSRCWKKGRRVGSRASSWPRTR